MPEAFVTLERRADGVALIRLDRPKANALSGEVLGQLAEVVEGLAADLPGAVVLWGGRRIFAAGADIAELESGVDPRVVGCELRARAGRAGLAAPGHHRRRQRVRPRGRARAGAGLRLPGLRRRHAAGPARNPPRRHPRGRGDPAPAAPDRRPRGPRSSSSPVVRCGPTRRSPSAWSTARPNPTGCSTPRWPGRPNWRRALWWPTAWPSPRSTLGLEGSLDDGLAVELEAFSAVFESEDARTGLRSFVEYGPGRATFAGR